MMTPLSGTLKRELDVAGVAYTLTLTADALRLTEKGKRLGRELKWAAIVDGEAALAVALQASLSQPTAKVSKRRKKPPAVMSKDSSYAAPKRRRRSAMRRS